MAEQTIIRYRGDSYSLQIVVRDPDGVAYDVSGADALFTVREFPDAETPILRRMSAEITGTDGAAASTAVAFTSAAPSAAFTAVLVGTVLTIESGTNDVPGVYPVVGFVGATALTLASTPTTGGAMSNAVYSIGGDITLASNGTVTVTFDPVQMAALEPGIYHYDLQLTLADGTVETVVAGQFIVRANVSWTA